MRLLLLVLLCDVTSAYSYTLLYEYSSYTGSCTLSVYPQLSGFNHPISSASVHSVYPITYLTKQPKLYSPYSPYSSLISANLIPLSPTPHLLLSSPRPFRSVRYAVQLPSPPDSTSTKLRMRLEAYLPP